MNSQNQVNYNRIAEAIAYIKTNFKGQPRLEEVAPVAYLIPCHRVILASGNLGGYMWGNTRKTAIIGWEGIKCNS